MSINKPAQHGFTLIELMMVVAIVGILAALALPSYNEHVRSTHRSLAAACLSEAAQQMERRYAASLSYNATTSFPALGCTSDIASTYTLSFSGALTAQAYTLQAVPQGGQAKDRCATLTLTHQGVKGASGASVASCWN